MLPLSCVVSIPERRGLKIIQVERAKPPFSAEGFQSPDTIPTRTLNHVEQPKSHGPFPRKHKTVVADENPDSALVNDKRVAHASVPGKELEVVVMELAVFHPQLAGKRGRFKHLAVAVQVRDYRGGPGAPDAVAVLPARTEKDVNHAVYKDG